MLAGGLTFAVPGVMPEAMAANANLYVSAENSQYDNTMTGPQVVEVVVIDSDINSLDDVHGEPTVTVNSKKLRMGQATDGNWYGYFADVQMAQLADYVAVNSGNGKGLDFGTFCSPSGATTHSGITFTETKGVAFPNAYVGANGTSSWNVTEVADGCQAFTGVAATSSSNGTNNVVREYKSLNLATSEDGQLAGINNADQATNSVWPFIQLYDFSAGGQIKVQYNKGGGAQTATLTFDTADGGATTTLDREFYPKGAQVFVEIADSWLNIDPTDEDSWTFNTVSGSETIKYRVYDEDGDTVASSSTDLTTYLTDMMQADAKLVINKGANAADVIEFTDNNIGPSSPSNTVTLLETGVNSGVFVNYDNEDTANIKVKDAAVRGNSATIDYDDSAQSIVVRSSFASIELSIDDDEWNSGEEATVTLIDQDLNKNSRSDEDLSVSTNSTNLIPTLITGNPLTLGETLTSTLDTEVANGVITTTGALTVTYGDDVISKLVVAAVAPKTSGDMTVAKYSHVGYINIDETTNDFTGMLVPLDATVADLTDVISTSSSFVGTSLFAWNVESINSTAQYRFYLVNGSAPLASGQTYTNALISLVNATSATGSVALSTGILNNISDLADSTDDLSILVKSEQTGTNLTNGYQYPVTFDFLSFGFTGDGDDASERRSNQIIRFELEESGDNTAVYEGTLEYIMINQLNVQQSATFTGLTLESDGPTFIAFEDLTDEDSPRINYLDLGEDGVSTQIADQLEAPSHSGKVSFDSESYKVADTVTITLEDADLNTDTSLVDIYTVVDGTADADRDQVGIDTSLADFSFGSLGRLLDVTFDDARWQYDAACSSLDGLSGTGFTLVETGRDTGVFTGNFQIPETYCNGTAAVSTTGVDIEVNYVDFRDASGEIIEVGDGAAVRAKHRFNHTR
jgi:hypothetical protein